MIGLMYEYDMKKVGVHFLDTILEGINLMQYIWKIDEDDIYLVPIIGNNYLFSGKQIDGEQLKVKITSMDYLVISCNLQAFPNEQCLSNLSTYKEYVASACEVVIKITDNKFVAILAKDKTVIKQLHKNAVKNGFDKIKFIHSLDDNVFLSSL